jgi:hypothetical protein
MRTGVAAAAALLAVAGGLGLAAALPGEPRPRAVAIARAALDSMGAIFAVHNEHWDELADLNTLEKMLGTVRPTQREYLGCLQGRVGRDTIWVDAWVPAVGMKQLQMAVAGSCDGVPRLVGTWHTHPYRADLRNLPVKERRLSAQDLATFAASPHAVTLVMWDVDSVDAALRVGGAVVHPVPVVARAGARAGPRDAHSEQLPPQ